MSRDLFTGLRSSVAGLLIERCSLAEILLDIISALVEHAKIGACSRDPAVAAFTVKHSRSSRVLLNASGIVGNPSEIRTGKGAPAIAGVREKG